MSVTAVAGLDAGATLIKVALRTNTGAVEELVIPAQAPDEAVRQVEAAGPTRVGLTGGGAAALRTHLPHAVLVDEFTAWRRGAATLLGEAAPARFLLVSLGTGTSMLLIEGERVTRIAGTPLGGGTVLGLGRALASTADFATLCAMAARGDRWRVDLSVADVYPAGDAPLDASVAAAAFGKATGANDDDRAAALMAMVGENVALLAGSLSLVVDVADIVVGGSTVDGNTILGAALADYVARFGRRLHVLDRARHVGALGALLAADPDIA